MTSPSAAPESLPPPRRLRICLPERASRRTVMNPELFAELDWKHRFTLDPCGMVARMPRQAFEHWTDADEPPHLERADGLEVSWQGERVLLCPPARGVAGRKLHTWICKALTEVLFHSADVVAVLPRPRGKGSWALWDDFIICRATHVELRRDVSRFAGRPPPVAGIAIVHWNPKHVRGGQTLFCSRQPRHVPDGLT